MGQPGRDGVSASEGHEGWGSPAVTGQREPTMTGLEQARAVTRLWQPDHDDVCASEGHGGAVAAMRGGRYETYAGAADQPARSASTGSRWAARTAG